MVSYNDPYFPTIGKGRKYDLQMKRTELENLGQYDCVLIVTDHSDYDYRRSSASRSWWLIHEMRPRELAVPRLCGADPRPRRGAI